jgi:hypothetical protein
MPLKASYFWVYLIFCLLTSCGEGIDGEALSLNKLGSNLEEDRSFNGEELAVAKRVCNSLRDKRSSLLDNKFNSTTFTLTQKRTDCDLVVTSQELTDVGINQGALGEPFKLEQTSNNKNFTEIILTNEDGILKNVCTQVLKGELPKIREVINDTSSMNIIFKTSDNLDSAFVFVGKKEFDSEGVEQFPINQEQRFKFLTTDSAGDFEGFTKEHLALELSCSTADKFIILQTILTTD